MSKGWEQVRQAITDLRAARDVPREQFPGHKEIYCSNLEGFLGGRVPALLAERDRYRDALEDIARDVGRPGDPAWRVAMEALGLDADAAERAWHD